MRDGWKVNATEYNRQQRYRQTDEHNFGISIVILTIVLLLIFG